MDTVYYSAAAAMAVFVAVQVTRPTTTLLVEQWVPKNEVAATVGVDDDVVDFQRELVVIFILSILLFYIIKWILQIRIVRYSVGVWAIAVAVYTTSSHLHHQYCGGNWKDILLNTFQVQCIVLKKVKCFSQQTVTVCISMPLYPHCTTNAALAFVLNLPLSNLAPNVHF